MTLLRPFTTVLAAAILMFAAASAALAHRAHAGLTEIGVNARTGQMEIVHRVFAHDLHDALGYESIDDSELYELPEGLAWVEAWARSGFSLQTVSGEPVELNYVGAERDGEFTFIYFTAQPPEEGSELVVDNGLLTGLLDDQVNLTNLRGPDGVQSVMQGPGRREPQVLTMQ